MTDTTPEASKNTPPLLISRKTMYLMIAHRSKEIIEKLFIETDSNNPSIRIAALRTLLNKVLPDLKAEQLVDEEGKQIKPTFVVLSQESKEQLEKLYAGLDSSND